MRYKLSVEWKVKRRKTSVSSTFFLKMEQFWPLTLCMRPRTILKGLTTVSWLRFLLIEQSLSRAAIVDRAAESEVLKVRALRQCSVNIKYHRFDSAPVWRSEKVNGMCLCCYTGIWNGKLIANKDACLNKTEMLLKCNKTWHSAQQTTNDEEKVPLRCILNLTTTEGHRRTRWSLLFLLRKTMIHTNERPTCLLTSSYFSLLIDLSLFHSWSLFG